MMTSDSSAKSPFDEAIQASPYLAGRHVRVDTESGRVILRGVVGSYYQKQMAQEVVRRVDGDRPIDNQLQVLRSGALAAQLT